MILKFNTSKLNIFLPGGGLLAGIKKKDIMRLLGKNIRKRLADSKELAIIAVPNIYRRESVSYTHLDVYKRQALLFRTRGEDIRFTTKGHRGKKINALVR